MHTGCFACVWGRGRMCGLALPCVFLRISTWYTGPTLRCPQSEFTEGFPRRVSLASMTSSWTKEAVWIISAILAISSCDSNNLEGETCLSQGIQSYWGESPRIYKVVSISTHPSQDARMSHTCKFNLTCIPSLFHYRINHIQLTIYHILQAIQTKYYQYLIMIHDHTISHTHAYIVYMFNFACMCTPASDT